MHDSLERMIASLERHGGVYRPSRFWRELNARNIDQLRNEGLENIKRTVAQNYFTWVVGVRSDQFRALARQMTSTDWREVLAGLPTRDGTVAMSRWRFLQLAVLTRMLWIAASRVDRHGLLDVISEPSFGNPFPIHFRGRLISQDVANSVIELSSILEGASLKRDRAFTVCEVGAGYGRTAFAMLSAFPRCRYVIVDIPPALYVAQEYLGRVLPRLRMMRFREDWNADAAAEFAEADLVFMLPHQVGAILDRSVDLFVNISSLHEMTAPQVSAYFTLIARVTRGHVYLKQWQRFVNAHDGVTWAEADYPYPPMWRRVFSRAALAQPAFFEAMYAVGGTTEA